MTAEEFKVLQKESEALEWCPHDDHMERLIEIDNILDHSPWSINPDDGMIVPSDRLIDIVHGELDWEPHEPVYMNKGEV